MPFFFAKDTGRVVATIHHINSVISGLGVSRGFLGLGGISSFRSVLA